MTATLKIAFAAWYEDADGRLSQIGDLSKTKTQSITGTGLDVRKAIGTSTTWSVWDSSQQPADFDLLVIVSDLAGVVVELTTDNNNGVGDEIYTIQLAANIPLIISSDGSYANYTANFAGGTIDVIDRIRIRNISTTDTANVHVWMAT